MYLLWQPRELSAFHDAQLSDATRQINAILSGVDRSNKDPDRTLSLIVFQNRLLLVWAEYGSISSDDDDGEVAKALGIKID
jgi:hypothetical protein